MVSELDQTSSIDRSDCKPSDGAIVRLTHELSQLRQEARNGWLKIGENPASVAEHSHRAAALGYLLAHAETVF